MAEEKKARPDIRTIRKMLDDGQTVKKIAEYYGCTKQTIYNKLKEADKRAPQMANLKPLHNVMVDPESGIAVSIQSGQNKSLVAHIGDERVTAFVNYHIEMMGMRQGVNKRDIQDLYKRFYRYLAYCSEHAIMPNNMNAYYAIGVTRQEICEWKAGRAGTPDHKRFAEDVTGFFSSIHEQAPTDGLMNPISAMFWQKAHDGMIEASKLEVVQTDPLGEKRSAEDIAKSYTEVELPD